MVRLVIFTLMFIALISGVKNCMKEETKKPIIPDVLFDEGFGVNDPIDPIVFAPFEREYPEEGFGISDAPMFVLNIEKIVTKQLVKPKPKKRLRKRKLNRRRCMSKRTKRSVDSWKICVFDPEKNYC